MEGKPIDARRGLPGLAWVVACCLAGVTAAAYVGVLRNGFVFDDTAYVLWNNRLRQGLSLEGLRWAFTSLDMANWHPLTWVSHLLDFQLFTLRAAGHHAVSLALHLIATCLLFAALRRGTGAVWPATLAAALFALHPLHVESVAWVSERKDVLSGAAWMAALLAYLWHCARPGPVRYAAVAATFALGLLAKPMVVTLPLVLLLLDFWPLGRWGGRLSLRRAALLVAEKVPLLALSTASGIVTIVAQSKGGAMFAFTKLSLPARAANAVVAAVSYLAKTLWPHPLSAYYPITHHPWWKVSACAVALAALTVAAFRWWRRHPFALTGWLWYLVTLLPVSGLLQVGMQAMADRYTYLPLVGPFVALSWGLARAVRGRPRAARALPALACAALALLAVRTSRQVAVWHDNLTLFRNVAAVTPDHWIPHYFYGLILARLGTPEEAEAEFRASLRLETREVEPYLALADVLRRLGRTAEVGQLYRQAVLVDHMSAEAHWGYAVALEGEGRVDEALAHYEESVRLDPGNAFFRARLAEAVARRAQAAPPPAPAR